MAADHHHAIAAEQQQPAWRLPAIMALLATLPGIIACYLLLVPRGGCMQHPVHLSSNSSHASASAMHSMQSHGHVADSAASRDHLPDTQSRPADAADAHASTLAAPARPKVAAFYQAHAQPAAVNKSLALFRKWYPAAPVLMINDGGDRALQALADYYNVTYRYVPRIEDDIAKAVDTSAPLIFGVFQGSSLIAATWVDYIFQALGDAEWLLNLEDDVHVLRPIDFATLQHDINGDNQGVVLPTDMHPVITSFAGGSPRDWHYGGCGGTVLRGDFWRTVRDSKPWLAQLRALFAAVRSVNRLGADQVISALAYANGGTIGPFPGFAETWHHDLSQRLAAGTVSVVHKEKSMYNVPFAYEALTRQPAGANSSQV